MKRTSRTANARCSARSVSGQSVSSEQNEKKVSKYNKEEEIMGLDVSHHGGNAYPGDNGLKVEKISSDISEEHRATPGMVRELGSKMEALEQLVNQALGTQVQKEE
eukprot:TRINITY_DN21968_c0_g1_i1.p3 TRINITY_DN21968_c0_g1~~TRINITY_DN21968_c0_g1_i1.p3  ORF type:complete len:106 (-),score=20.16 TRINITY_DN21968_c0_g1_i1:230-547(-)